MSQPAKSPKKVKQEPKLKSASFSLEQYFTKDQASVPTKMSLVLPNGMPTEDYLLVVGSESKEFRHAKLTQERNAVVLGAITDSEKMFDGVEEMKASMLAACVKDWSFDVPCTPDNVLKFLLNAPYITDALDRFISARSNFFKLASVPSTNT